MNLAIGRRLKLRLFIEGVEVPVISANVNASTGSPAIASIQIIPTAAALGLLPRSMVHLFFFDRFATRTLDSGKVVPEAEDMQYSLLFMGEVIGYGYSKGASSRSVTLQCIDFSSYWQIAYAYYLMPTGTPSELVQEQAKFVQASTGILHGAAGNNHGLVLSQLLFESPQSPEFAHLTGLLGGILRIIEVMTGIRGEQGINDFFTLAELRCHLLAQIGAPEGDTQARDLLKSSQIEAWITDKVLSLGSLVSLKDIIGLLLDYIYYEVVPNPTPKFVSSGYATKEEPAVDPTTLDAVQRMSLQADQTLFNLEAGNLGAAITSITELLGDEATSNALISKGRGAEIVNNAMASLANVTLGGLFSKASVSIKQTAVNRTLSKSIESVEAPLKVAYSNILAAESVGPNERAPFIETAVSALEGVTNTLNFMKDAGTIKTTQETNARAYTTLFKPNIFYAPPPTCNVIFPEQYHSLSYDRQFLSEITRTHLSVSVSEKANIGEEFPDVFYAPNTAGKLNELQSTWAAENPEEIGRLMEHEYHIGIVPHFANLSRLQFYTKEAREQANIADESAPLYFQRLANFKFFEERFKTRSLNVAGTFNPNIVVGFPAAIIDRPILDPGVKTVADVAKHGDEFNQYIAVPVTISHILDQNTGGSTQINCLYARTHRGRDDEFLRGSSSLLGVDISKTLQTTLDYHQLLTTGDLNKLNLLFNITKETGEQSVIKKNSLGKELNAPKSAGSVGIGSQGIHGQIVAIDVIDSSPAGGEGSEIESTDLALRFMQSGTITVDASLLADVLIPNPDAKLPIPVYKKVAIYEMSSGGPVTDIQLPVEEVIRPIWISKIYRNPEIGKQVYMPLLGVGSIVDVNLDGTGIEPVSFDGQQFVATEKGVDLITVRYSAQRRAGQTADFVDGYTYRKIATLREILGQPSKNDLGMYGSSFKGDVPLAPGTETTVRGVDVYDASCTPATPHPLPDYLDTRKEKFSRVWQYRSSLKNRGLSG